MDKHLWEVDHHYYCNESNYYAPGYNQPMCHYSSWEDFIENEGDNDFDMNLLFRWDWKEGTEEYLEEQEYDKNYFLPKPYNGDDSYKNGKLFLFWMGQRKGLYRWTTIEVCRDDEQKIVEFLKPRFKHLMSLWDPIQ